MRDAEPPADFVDPPSFLMTLHDAERQAAREGRRRSASPSCWKTGNWEVAAHDETSVTFRRALPELNLEIIKRYTLEPVPPEQREDVNYPGYHLQLDVELRNTGDAAQSVAYRLDGPTGMPLEGWWYAHKISQRTGSARPGCATSSSASTATRRQQIDCPQIAEGEVEPMGQGAGAGVRRRRRPVFFRRADSDQKSLDEVWFDTTEAIVVGPKPDARRPLRSPTSPAA